MDSEPSPEPVVVDVSPSTQRSEDGIAIVGMACRFPGANNLSEYWRLLESGTDAITSGRPNNGDGPQIWGGYIDDIEWFDSRFFRIAPVEARLMDPQQRVMLEASWEALEDAGIDPSGLRGSRTGVYVGLGGSEYRDLIESSGKLGNYLGTNASVAAGRIAFALGLEGPAMAIDMACASSLAAVHQAVSALERGEVELALAGGAHFVLSSAVSDFMKQLGLLSTSGQSRPFDASADGSVRGEGCGVLALKRLSDAEADGDRIWAVIKGSAVNQNGASAGLTIPNGPAQERVMEAALSQAGFPGAEVDYLEAHATGSQLGDAIEAHAIASVYGKGREAGRPLLMGTVKSNIGHLEAAAGVAGLIKAVLSMKQGVIPRHLHFETPNPQIDWNSVPLRITSEKAEWPGNRNRQPRAAVSAFGISGTNAHVVLEGYDGEGGAGNGSAGFSPFVGTSRQVEVDLPQQMADLAMPTDGLNKRMTRLLPLSGRSGGALQELAKRYISWLDGLPRLTGDNEAEFLADMAWTASVGRSHFDHRMGVAFDGVESLRKGLSNVAERVAVTEEEEPKPAERVAFVYSGDVNEWIGMGKGLYDREPVVRAVLDRCDALVLTEKGVSLLDVMFGEAGAEGYIADSEWTQPALYSLQCAFTSLWASIGIEPNIVLGFGAGEIAAAQAAGILSMEDGLRFTLARGVMMSDMSREVPDQPSSGLEKALVDITFVPPAISMVSSVTGQVVDSGTVLDTGYWRRQARENAPLAACASTLSELGVDLVVGIGPAAMLKRTMNDARRNSREAPMVLSVVDGASDEVESLDGPDGFVKAVAEAYTAGLGISYEGLFGGETRRRVSLPSYPFQRRRHWI